MEQDATLHLLELKRGKLEKVDSADFDATSQVAVNSLIPIQTKDNKPTFIAGDTGGTLKVFQVEGEKLKEVQSVNCKEAVWAHFAPPTLLLDGRTLVITNGEDALHVLRFKEGKLTRVTDTKEFKVTNSTPTSFPDGKTFAVACKDNKVRVIRLEDDKLKEVASVDARHSYIYDPLDVSPDGKILTVSSHVGPTLYVFRLDNDKLTKIGKFKALDSTSTFYSYSPTIFSDNKTIAFPTSAGYLHILQINGTDLKEAGKIPIQSDLYDPTCITKIKDRKGIRKDILIIGSDIYYYFNLSKPTERLKSVQFK